MVSLKKIASELNVSYTLVSKVLSGRMGTTGVSEATREAILEKACELDYRPNRAAVALKRGRRGAIGVFVHSMGVPGSEITPVFLASLAGTLDDSDYRLWLRFFRTDEDFLAAFDDKLRNEVDGLIVGGAEHRELLEKLAQIDGEQLPVVSVFCENPLNVPITNVAVDYEAQCYLTTRHLLERGCRHIAYFRVMELRHKGFLRAHREMGVPVNEKLILSSGPGDYPFFLEDGLRFTRQLLESGERFDGIVAESDVQAAAAERVLLAHGLRIPQEVRVTGIDNSPIAESSLIPITSSSAEMDQCGRCAVELLLRKVSGKKASSVIVMPQLVVRESTL